MQMFADVGFTFGIVSEISFLINPLLYNLHFICNIKPSISRKKFVTDEKCFNNRFVVQNETDLLQMMILEFT